MHRIIQAFWNRPQRSGLPTIQFNRVDWSRGVVSLRGFGLFPTHLLRKGKPTQKGLEEVRKQLETCLGKNYSVHVRIAEKTDLYLPPNLPEIELPLTPPQFSVVVSTKMPREAFVENMRRLDADGWIAARIKRVTLALNEVFFLQKALANRFALQSAVNAPLDAPSLGCRRSRARKVEKLAISLFGERAFLLFSRRARPGTPFVDVEVHAQLEEFLKRLRNEEAREILRKLQKAAVVACLIKKPPR
ncbi:MAG: hypothetical protein QW343_02925 [Candidatus Norongarragalinales archaeon]